MGYHLSELYSISSNDQHDYFLFLVGEYGLDKKSRWIVKSFDTIAAALKGKSVIIRGVVPQFDRDVMRRYKSNIETFLFADGSAAWEFDKSLHHYLHELTKDPRESIWDLYPILIVTNQKPTLPISEKRDVVFYLIPIGGLSDVREARELVLAIVQGTLIDDFTRLEQLLEKNFPRSAKRKPIEIVNQTLELKPNFFGLGINLNKLIDMFLQQKRSNSRNILNKP